jgi:hypothetical protein
MDILDHNAQPFEKWREGVITRMRMSSLRVDDNCASLTNSVKPGPVLRLIFTKLKTHTRFRLASTESDGRVNPSTRPGS